MDSAFSLEPVELAGLVQEPKRAWQSLGEVRYGPSDVEIKSLIFRRSLYACSDIKAGEILTEQNLRIVRPGLGLEPEHFAIVIGMRVK